jgi:hypothetical protein
LLGDPRDRVKLLTLLDKLVADPRIQAGQPSPEQLSMLERIRGVLGSRTPALERRLHSVPAPVPERRAHAFAGA